MVCRPRPGIRRPTELGDFAVSFCGLSFGYNILFLGREKLDHHAQIASPYFAGFLRFWDRSGALQHSARWQETVYPEIQLLTPEDAEQPTLIAGVQISSHGQVVRIDDHMVRVGQWTGRDYDKDIYFLGNYNASQPCGRWYVEYRIHDKPREAHLHVQTGNVPDILNAGYREPAQRYEPETRVNRGG